MKILETYECGFSMMSLVELENQYFLVEDMKPSFTDGWVTHKGLLMPEEDAKMWLDAVDQARKHEQKSTRFKQKSYSEKEQASYFKRKIRKINASLFNTGSIIHNS